MEASGIEVITTSQDLELEKTPLPPLRSKNPISLTEGFITMTLFEKENPNERSGKDGNTVDDSVFIRVPSEDQKSLMPTTAADSPAIHIHGADLKLARLGHLEEGVTWITTIAAGRTGQDINEPRITCPKYTHTPKQLRSRRAQKLRRRRRLQIALKRKKEAQTQEIYHLSHPSNLQQKGVLSRPRLTAYEDISDLELPPPKFPQVGKRSVADLEVELREAMESSLLSLCWEFSKASLRNPGDTLEMGEDMADPSLQRKYSLISLCRSSDTDLFSVLESPSGHPSFPLARPMMNGDDASETSEYVDSSFLDGSPNDMDLILDIVDSYFRGTTNPPMQSLQNSYPQYDIAGKMASILALESETPPSLGDPSSSKSNASLMMEEGYSPLGCPSGSNPSTTLEHVYSQSSSSAPRECRSNILLVSSPYPIPPSCVVEIPLPSPVLGSRHHLRGGGGSDLGFLAHLFGAKKEAGSLKEGKNIAGQKVGLLDWYIVGGPARGMTWGQFAELTKRRIERTKEIERKKREEREAARKAKEEKKKKK